MQQHAVPQNVTQYQFRLVGDMTLKQFLELAGGLVLAYLFYASNLIFIIKWPLALLSLFLGIALAFFPLEERPLDVWIINFLKSIYAPTRFVWQKTKNIPRLFDFQPHPIVEKATATKTVKAPVPASAELAVNDLSDQELDRIKNLESIIGRLEQKSAPAAKTASSPPAKTIKPSVEVRKLKPASVIFDADSLPKPKPITHIEKKSAPPKEPKEVIVPQTEEVGITKDKTPTPPPPKPQEKVVVAAPSVQTQNVQATATTQAIHLPASPKKPNIVVGMVVDQSGHLIENAIVEILTQDGIPARAIKTNSLGQFFISTPLSPGDYTIQAESEGLTFPTQSLPIKDDLVSPLLIRAN